MKLKKKALFIAISIFIVTAAASIGIYGKSIVEARNNENKTALIQEAAAKETEENSTVSEEPTTKEVVQEVEEQKSQEVKIQDVQTSQQNTTIENKTSSPTPTKETVSTAVQEKPQPSPQPTVTPSPQPTPAPAPQLLIDTIKGKGNAEQAIVVTTDTFSSVNAKITTYEKVNGVWKQLITTTGVIGRNGFALNKIEGDGKSPIGIFSLGTAFGKYGNPGTKLAYRQTNANDFWVDDKYSSLYNTWQVGPVNGRWTSAENLLRPTDKLYDYAFVINYNTAERISGKGSAIFFHIWRGAGYGTAGCTATTQDNVLAILRWLNPSKNPVIIQGPSSEISKM